MLFLFSSCKNTIKIKLKNPPKANSSITVSNIQVINHQFIITGNNLADVTSFKIMNGAATTNLVIESKSSTSIVANTLANVSFASGAILDFILSSANASATFQVNMTVANNTITAPMLTSMGATIGQIMKYNGTAWVPSSITNAQIYLGTWNATTNSPDLTIPSSIPGDYYIVSTAGTFSSVTYAIGDWIISDGYNWQKVANSAVVVSTFQGRRGIVTLVPGDYVSLKNGSGKLVGSSLNDLADINIAATPNNGDVLKYDTASSKWISGVIAAGGGTVTDVTSANADIGISAGTSIPILTLNSGVGPNQIVKLTGASKLPAVDGSLLTGLNPTNLSAAVAVNKGGTGLTAGTAGGIPYFNTTTTMASSALGTSGQILTSAGTSAPAWITSLPLANGGTGGTDAATARTALGIASGGTYATGSTTGSIPLLGTGGIVGSNLCSGDNAGGIICTAMTSSIVAGAVSDESGTGALLFGTAPSITDPVITNIAPAANFTLTQNAVVPFTSENTGAVANTLYLKAGNVGVGTTSPAAKLQVGTPVGGTLFSTPAALVVGSMTSTYAAPQLVIADSTSQNKQIMFGWDSTNNAGGIQAFTQGVGGSSLLLNTLGGNVGIGTTTPGSKLDVKGTLRLSGSTSGFTGFDPGATPTNTTYLLPSNQGTSGQVLTTNGTATTPTLTWTTPASAGSATLTGDIVGTVGANTIDAGKVTLTHLSATGTKDATTYLKGNNTWSVLQTDVQGLILSAYAVGTNTALAATDSVVGAFGKLQKQITDLGTLAVGGDLSGTLPNPVVAKIQGTAVSAAAPTNGNFLKYVTGAPSNWVGSMVTVGDLKSTALGSLFPGTGCLANQTLYYSVVGDAFSCLDIGTLDAAKITTGTIAAARLPASATYWDAATGGINYAGGNVGVGTTSPSQLLEVKGTAGVPATSGTTQASIFRLGNASNNLALDIGQLSGAPYTTWIQNTNKPDLSVNYPLALNPNGGNVGIGTSAPGNKLTVTGASVAGSGSQTNISAYAGNGIRLDGSIANSSQDSITYQSGGGGGAAITFRRDGSYGTFLDFYTNNTSTSGAITQAMTINNVGNVGIGTTSPAAPLHIGADSGTTPGVLIGGGTSASNFIGFASSRAMVGYNVSSNLALNAGSGKGIEFFVNGTNGTFPSGTEAMYINSSGNVGIGTTVPSATLHLKSSVSTASGMLLLENDTAAQTGLYTARSALAHANKGVLENSDGILINPSGGNVGIGTIAPAYKLTVVGGDIALDRTNKLQFAGPVAGDSNRAYIAGNPNNDLIFGTGGATEAMRILYTGNVGIGTTTPGSGGGGMGSGAFANNILSLSTTGRPALIVRSDNTTSMATVVMSANNATARDLHINHDNAGNTDFYQYRNGSSGTGLYLQNNGNIGIGTTSPVARLDITSPATTGRLRIFSALNSSNNTIQIDQFGTAHGVLPSWNIISVQNSEQGLGFVTDDSAAIEAGTSTKGLFIKSGGNVGIGTTSPVATLTVNGSVSGTSAYQTISDFRFKKDIVRIPNALEKLLTLDGVFYNFRNEEFPDRNMSHHREMGVIAQKVEKVFPEAVSKDAKGFRSVAYTMLIAPIIEAIRELFHTSEIQSREIASVKARATKLELENNKLKVENNEMKIRLDRIEKALKFAK